MSLNSYIAKQFGNPAGLSGRMVALVMNHQNRPLYDETIRLLSLSDSERVLDIGCGNGYVLHLLARQYDSVFVGIDISKSMIKAASRRNHAFVRNGKMTLAHQDASAMSFAEGSFDKAYTINTVYFWDDLKNMMTEIRRVLKPGGLFVNAFYSNETLSRLPHTQFGYERYSLEQLTDSGVSMGFTVNVVPVLHGAAYCLLYRREG